MHTSDLDEYVEAIENAVAWEYDAEEGVARVFVTEKLPEAELDDGQLIATALGALGVETDVVSVGGEFTPEVVDPRRDPDVRPAGAPSARHRPIPDGVSEINAKSTAATAGYYEAQVVDPSAAEWAESAGYGDIVRLSNNHVYARINEADFGEPIIQPSPRDGGSLPGDRVGVLVGYVPLEDGTPVDIAARSIDDARDTAKKHDLPDRFGSGVRREPYAGLKYDKLTKTGRTTGVTSGTVLATNATANVRYPGGQVKVRDVIMTTGMSQGGDSGSDVFVDTTGAYVGALFAGSPTSTLICKAANIERELGVELRTRDTEPGEDTQPWWRELLDWLF